MRQYKYKTVVIGGGPAGTGLLFNAINKNQLKEFLGSGVAYIEKTDDLGCGSIGKYLINSDTEGRVFLECLTKGEGVLFRNEKLVKMAQLISCYESTSVPLQLVGDYLKLLGIILKEEIEKSHASDFFPKSTAVSIYKNKSTNFLTKIKTTINGYEKESWIKSDFVVFAMGGKQEREKIINTFITDSISLKNYDDKIILTDNLFTNVGILAARNLILKGQNKKIVIIGSSHSALSSICVLLNKIKEVNFEENDITLMYRGKFKLFYPTKEQAWNDGYYDFTDEDICPVSQRVYRLGGVRLESRDMLKKIFGLSKDPLTGHSGNEKRVRLLKICSNEENTSEIKNVLEEASLIIPAFGYRPHAIPLYDENNRSVELSCENGGSLVNNNCQVIDAKGKVISGLYGIGLASGFVPHGKLGGEPGFTGQTNGLWLYQNGVGEIIFDQLMGIPDAVLPIN